MHRQTFTETERQRGNVAETGRLANKKADRQAGRQASRQTDRHTHTHTHLRAAQAMELLNVSARKLAHHCDSDVR
eukprot:15473155-Alexandrium_andersonii.AAC.1